MALSNRLSNAGKYKIKTFILHTTYYLVSDMVSDIVRTRYFPQCSDLFSAFAQTTSPPGITKYWNLKIVPSKHS